MQCCQCEVRCVDDNCQCGKLSLRCWYDEEGKLIPEFNFGGKFISLTFVVSHTQIRIYHLYRYLFCTGCFLLKIFLFVDIPMIFECNDSCSCNAITCNNRVVQKGLTQRFELFKTEDRGWGIRTLRPIPKGSFVCEYIGEIITDLEADRREDDSFLFDLENRVCKNNVSTRHVISGNIKLFISGCRFLLY